MFVAEVADVNKIVPSINMEQLTEFQLHKAIINSNAETRSDVYNLLESETPLDETKKEIVLKSFKRFSVNKQQWFKSKKLKLDLREYEKKLPNGQEVLFEYEPTSTEKTTTSTENTPVKRKKFRDLDRKQQLRRTQKHI